MNQDPRNILYSVVAALSFTGTGFSIALLYTGEASIAAGLGAFFGAAFGTESLRKTVGDN